jgi:hypothetical protein
VIGISNEVERCLGRLVVVEVGVGVVVEEAGEGEVEVDGCEGDGSGWRRERRA